MPTFKNITVTISPTTSHPHLPSPLPEYGTLKQSRKSTITTYIPSTANVNFAISIVITSSYVTLTNSQNESLAAYVYFDGRSKEETATLLRRGQETWISSRWVEMPDKSLAEKEFVFKEVGLEIQLNGLGLDSKENGTSKKKLKRTSSKSKHGSPDEADDGDDTRTNPRRHSMPVHSFVDDDDDDDDEESCAKATAGQIRVDLFRVLAEGPVKKGEYHPMFKEGEEDPEHRDGPAGVADLEYTAGFSEAKPLDAESISTQSVSHIDHPSSPYATFIFFYRGERQLHRMGIIPKSARSSSSGPNARPRPKNLLDSLSGKTYVGKGKGKGWEDFRDRNTTDRMIDEEEELGHFNGMEENVIEEEEVIASSSGGPEGEVLSEGVRKMKLKRGFAEDPDEARTNTSAAAASLQSSPPKPTSSSFPPFSGSSRYSTPSRRNGSGLSPPPFANGALNGFASPKSTAFGNGLSGLRNGIPGSIAGLSNGLSSHEFIGMPSNGSGSTSTSDEDKYTPKKRRQNRQLVDEEIL